MNSPELRSALIGFDTDDGQGERLILRRTGSYQKPLITPKGDRVVYSEVRRGIPRFGEWSPGEKVMITRTRNVAVHVVNWDGTNERTIAPGYAIEVWQDPQTGKEWVFVQAGPHPAWEYERNSIYRYPLDEPGPGVLVWDRTPVDAIGEGSFQISADGRRAAGLLPWPVAGVIDLEKEQWTRWATGCWTGMAPDNSYRTWVFDGAHRHLLLAAPQGVTTAKVNLTALEGMEGREVYHPRWSNDPSLFTMTGPYDTDVGERMQGTREVEVLIGRFSDAYSKVDDYTKLTSNSRPDYFPDLWVEREPFPANPGVVADSADTQGNIEWPGDSAGLVFLWKDGNQNSEIFDPVTQKSRTVQTTMRGFARYGQDYAMEFRGGGATFESQGGESEMLKALQNGNELSLEATIEPSGLPSRPRSIILLGNTRDKANFVLEQDGEEIVFRIRTTSKGEEMEYRVAIGSVQPNQRAHVVVTYSPYGYVRGYINGSRTIELRVPVGGFSAWSQHKLRFGGTGIDSDFWSGQMDGVAVYDVVLGDDQVARHAALNEERLAGRPPAARIIVAATLKEKTPIPDPRSIAPYRRCLVVYRYHVEKVISGQCDESEIQVAHWAVLDAEKVDGLRPEENVTYRLELEPFDANPQLESERIDMAVIDFDSELYYDPIPWQGRYSATARRLMANDESDFASVTSGHLTEERY